MSQSADEEGREREVAMRSPDRNPNSLLTRTAKASMLIPINLPTDVSSRFPPLPPSLLEFGDEIVIIELQGSLITEGNTDGQIVGTLTINPETKVVFSPSD